MASVLELLEKNEALTQSTKDAVDKLVAPASLHQCNDQMPRKKHENVPGVVPLDNVPSWAQDLLLDLQMRQADAIRLAFVSKVEASVVGDSSFGGMLSGDSAVLPHGVRDAANQRSSRLTARTRRSRTGDHRLQCTPPVPNGGSAGDATVAWNHGGVSAAQQTTIESEHQVTQQKIAALESENNSLRRKLAAEDECIVALMKQSVERTCPDALAELNEPVPM
eukprot:gnl/TRDRNA2_/TRDRNA2_168689_c1_seq3.p1 gnl/TRDRNA2_/TRDRNA2_168689_c1~~gnl/TRDRNA2_/TRDRNA2_168689_c1_seq3.p1  ORF type:complete len:253 (-),score=40.75 gnl/TRDRNA2_/TRDRNA2_168689_c1_seq3:163-828(-)